MAWSSAYLTVPYIMVTVYYILTEQKNVMSKKQAIEKNNRLLTVSEYSVKLWLDQHKGT